MLFRELRPGVFLANLEAENVNIVALLGSQCAALVDAGASPEQGLALRSQVDDLADARGIRLGEVMLTHAHWDHSFGLNAFADLSIIAQEQWAEDLNCAEDREAAGRLGVDLAALPQPQSLIALIGLRQLGGLTVEIAHLGPAHSRCDLIMAIPEQSTFIVGDLVEMAGPQFDETSSIEGWVKTLDALYSMVHDDSLIIPGHGPALNRAELAHFRSGLAAIWDQSEWVFRQGVAQDDAYDHDGLEWPWDRSTVEAGIAASYRELRARV
ncbi:MAG: MBL fold metallo-hydrolase [Propionibacteriaceae bacterium]|jgi:glyoxylase-like metal-dependent hydrolase (beta-lactamase superfamily II)|nr:MBL fold metallo-hydrolase [Propionibacteriaceae bacterium]